MPFIEPFFGEQMALPKQLLLWWRSLSPANLQFLALVISLAVLGMGLLLWALLFRKRGQRSYSLYVRPPNGNGGFIPGDGHAVAFSKRRRRRHRHRQLHGPRNPTLAQTGGLPPSRSTRRPGPVR